jgi:hypothetical protein
MRGGFQLVAENNPSLDADERFERRYPSRGSVQGFSHSARPRHPPRDCRSVCSHHDMSHMQACRVPSVRTDHRGMSAALIQIKSFRCSGGGNRTLNPSSASDLTSHFCESERALQVAVVTFCSDCRIRTYMRPAISDIMPNGRQIMPERTIPSKVPAPPTLTTPIAFISKS